MLGENLKERDNLRGLDVNGSTVLKWILRKQDARVWTGFIRFTIGASDGLL
jgi:hypothetical protein